MQNYFITRKTQRLVIPHKRCRLESLSEQQRQQPVKWLLINVELVDDTSFNSPLADSGLIPCHVVCLENEWIFYVYSQMDKVVCLSEVCKSSDDLSTTAPSSRYVDFNRLYINLNSSREYIINTLLCIMY